MEKVLSIIIPTYNAEKFLDKGLSSLVVPDSQLLKKIEVLVVDDGTPDDSVAIAQKYVAEYPEVFRVLSKENGGHGSAINAGVKNITGTYFKVLDADDWVDTQVLSQTVKYLESLEEKQKNCADAVMMSYTAYDITLAEEGKNPSEDKCIEQSGGPYSAEYINEHLYEFWYGISLHGLIYNTEFYRGIGIGLTEKVFYEDQEFSIVPLSYAKKIYAYDKSLYQYRVGDVAQSVSLQSSLKRLDHYEKVIDSLIAAGQDVDRFSEGGEKLWFNKTVKFINDYIHLCLIRNPQKRQLRKRIKQFVKTIKAKNQQMYKVVHKNYVVFKMLNYFHMSEKYYDEKFMPLVRRVSR